MKITDIWPVTSLIERSEYELSLEHHDNLEEISKLKPTACFEMGAFAYHICLADKKIRQSPKIEKLLTNTKNTQIIQKLEDIIKKPVIKEICFQSAWAPGQKSYDTWASHLLIASILDEYMYIEDVLFANLKKPITQSHGHKKHKGLGLFSVLLENTIKFSKEKNIPYIALTALGPDEKLFFESFGFKPIKSRKKSFFEGQKILELRV